MAGRHGRAAVLAVRSRACSRRLAEPRAEEWLLIEWPAGENAPTKYWLSTLPEDMSFRRLVDFAELRWRIERDYQELKQEGSAILKGEDGAASTTTPRSDERETISPSGPRCAGPFPPSALPNGYRLRGFRPYVPNDTFQTRSQQCVAD